MIQDLSSDELSNIAWAANDPSTAIDLETAVGSSVFTDHERSTLQAEQMEQRMEQAFGSYFHAVIELCRALSAPSDVVPKWATDSTGWSSWRAWLASKEWDHHEHDDECPSVLLIDCYGHRECCPHSMWEDVDEQWQYSFVKLSYVNENVLEDKLGIKLHGYHDSCLCLRLTHTGPFNVRKSRQLCWLYDWLGTMARALADAFNHPSADSLSALQDATLAMRNMADKVSNLYVELRECEIEQAIDDAQMLGLPGWPFANGHPSTSIDTIFKAAAKLQNEEYARRGYSPKLLLIQAAEERLSSQIS